MRKKLTIVSATDFEIRPFLDHLNQSAIKFSPTSFQFGNQDIEILITGIGILHSTYALMDYLMDHKPDAWIQMGIGGAFDRSLSIGDVYVIESEILVDFGAQDKDGRIIDQFELGWMKPDQFPYKNEVFTCPFIYLGRQLPMASGMTTIHSHGNPDKIKKLSEGLHGQIENMEGAAFFYVSLMKKIPFLSLRSVSNYVEPRNTSNWQIQTAIKNLNENVIQILNEDFFDDKD